MVSVVIVGGPNSQRRYVKLSGWPCSASRVVLTCGADGCSKSWKVTDLWADLMAGLF